MKAKKSAYTRPTKPCWVKVVASLPSTIALGIEEGNVYPVVQVLWDSARGATPVRIKSPSTGELVGLVNHEFSYCDKSGECLS